jgi:hypothetical protein
MLYIDAIAAVNEPKCTAHTRINLRVNHLPGGRGKQKLAGR